MLVLLLSPHAVWYFTFVDYPKYSTTCTVLNVERVCLSICGQNQQHLLGVVHRR